MLGCIGTPFYIKCWIVLLLNLHCMWFTPCRNLSLLFMHCIGLDRTLQNPTSAVLHLCDVCVLQNPFAACLHFMAYFAQLFCWFWIAGTAKLGRHALYSTLFDQQICIWYKNGRQQTFMWEQCCRAKKSFAS